MKKLLAPLLFAQLAGCHVTPASNSSVKDLVLKDELLPESVDSVENFPGYCEVNWTDEKIKSISKLNDFDKPLVINVEDFKAQAVKKLKEMFGEVKAGTVVYQDMLGTGDGAYFDYARLYYMVPLPESFAFLGSDMSLAYSVSAAGEINIGFTKKVEAGHFDFAYPGIMISYESGAITKAEFIEKMNKLKNEVAPDLIWNKGDEIKPFLTLWVPVALTEYREGHEPVPVTAKQIAQFSKLIETLAADETHPRVEGDGEATIGTPTHGKAIGISSSAKTVDLNALRSVSRLKVNEGGRFATLPSLAKPFGIGCVVVNPLLDLGEEK